MGSTGDKIKGKANEAIGKIKQGVGEATDNPRLKGEGRVQETKGKAQQLKGEVKDTLKRGIDRA
ncbi:CsbD family protein [Azotobacter beijerinckii]|uniref:CsbD family protein n=1 Tax=Azotobacter beijerinckii TaxID=170623 RepID=UPI0029547B5E|nr:CsbD family protein [Azotobacter beijerinckii]MDV7213015.1 CsbD family protein [Azotobacter beijerinckii]